MKVAVYARVSTSDKDQDPETQLMALRDYVKSQGWEVYREYVDQAPANDFAHRRAWRDMLDDASRRRFKVILVFKLDRALSAGDIAGLANGTSPGRLSGSNMWYLPMAAGAYAEHRKGGLTVSNTGSTAADHAPVGPMFAFDVGFSLVAVAAAPFTSTFDLAPVADVMVGSPGVVSY